MADARRRIVLAMVLAGTCAMFAAAVMRQAADRPPARPPSQFQASKPAWPGASAAGQEIPGGMEIMGLMQQMKNNPGNLDTLLELARVFSEQGNAEGALDMLERARQAAPSDPRPPYLAGVQLAALEKWAEAAASLEQSIRIADDASARFSLGVIYRYHLDRKADALAQFKAASGICKDEGLGRLIADEIAKAD